MRRKISSIYKFDAPSSDFSGDKGLFDREEIEKYLENTHSSRAEEIFSQLKDDSILQKVSGNSALLGKEDTMELQLRPKTQGRVSPCRAFVRVEPMRPHTHNNPFRRRQRQEEEIKGGHYEKFLEESGKIVPFTYHQLIKEAKSVGTESSVGIDELAQFEQDSTGFVNYLYNKNIGMEVEQLAGGQRAFSPILKNCSISMERGKNDSVSNQGFSRLLGSFRSKSPEIRDIIDREDLCLTGEKLISDPPSSMRRGSEVSIPSLASTPRTQKQKRNTLEDSSLAKLEK